LPTTCIKLSCSRSVREKKEKDKTIYKIGGSEPDEERKV
jgi:hypothetical protein